MAAIDRVSELLGSDLGARLTAAIAEQASTGLATVTATTAVIGGATVSAAIAPVVASRVSFTETAGAGTYTGSVTVPAGATILDIKVRSTVVWNNSGAAAMIVGDATDPNGWFDAINLKATDLIPGEEINFIQTGGKEGAYLNTTTGARTAAYSASARTITGEITTASTGGGNGRTTMDVIWANPTATAATKA
jgi:hypothetical protein